ncbi:aspartate racemase [Agrobacterium larrymoorei]|uniref:Aspartate racemase n=2 Tax=Agrobacterium larrymoorei TaxID=160699 RepID=A0ABU0UK44_9HYPH|nr:aspartate racemase [Agrobacterium larrymoorei]
MPDMQGLMSDKKRIIGIIGGAGVAASAELVQRIEQKVTAQGAFRDSHHPELLLYNATQVPSRSMYLEGRGESFVPGYVDAAEKLKNAGASFVAMCCNTAHYARREIAREAGIPILNLLAESLASAVNLVPNVRRIGILCSDGTRKAGLFEREAANLELNTELVYPAAEYQQMVTLGICNIKKGYHRSLQLSDPARPAHLYSKAAANLIEKGAEVVILGCTEVPLDFLANDCVVPVIDTINILADACIAISSGYRDIPE